MKRSGVGRVRGFTLVEVLVAVLVFGLLASAAYVGLNSLTRALELHRQQADALAAVQRIVVRLDGDLRQLLSRTGRDAMGRVLPALQSGSGSLLARRAGWANPAAMPRSRLQQFRWQLRDGILTRESWFQVDDDPAQPPVSAQRFGSASVLAFRFRDRLGRWHSSWPVEGPPSRLPTAVEYVFQTDAFGTVRRMVVL